MINQNTLDLELPSELEFRGIFRWNGGSEKRPGGTEVQSLQEIMAVGLMVVLDL